VSYGHEAARLGGIRSFVARINRAALLDFAVNQDDTGGGDWLQTRPPRDAARDPELAAVAAVAMISNVSVLETIVEELKALPAPKLAEAASYIHRLKETTREERVAALRRSATMLSEAEGAELEKAIEEGCEKIDARDW
jgi:hypothetical protein